jgi:hypothetical protein
MCVNTHEIDTVNRRQTREYIWIKYSDCDVTCANTHAYNTMILT